MKVYFSDFFEVDQVKIEKYGSFNVSLISDLPLFIDPFLLFNSSKPAYRKLHKDILKYVGFLRDRSIKRNLTEGLLEAWFHFKEIKENWLGYSKIGNRGHGLGPKFAKALNQNLKTVFSDFDKKGICQSPHLEKLCLIKENVGRDNISDFTTNLIKGYLLQYTQKFALKYIQRKYLKKFNVSRVSFNSQTSRWNHETFILPSFNKTYVLLTPKDMLTKEDTWINKNDLFDDFQEIVSSVSNKQLRDELSFYFSSNLPPPVKDKRGKEKEPSKSEIGKAILAVVNKYPDILNFYIKHKEDNGHQAKSISSSRVKEVQDIFVDALSAFIDGLSKNTNFYKIRKNTLAASYERVMFLKDVIENKDGYRIFYYKMKPIKKEEDLHVMFRLTWYASINDVTPEANAGRGPVDFKISYGSKDKTLVEFKLASNSKLRQNLENQVEIYKKAHDTKKSIKVILFFSVEEEARVKKILKELKLTNEKYVVLIDARKDNKPSASKAQNKGSSL